MNLSMKLWKKRKKNNGGFSLIEIVLAIAVLAIVIAPVFNSFITSARVNMNARKTMAATNVAQTILEGFADKKYSDIGASIGYMASGTVDLSGMSALSSVDNNYYNLKDNFSAMSVGGPLTAAGLSAVSSNEITFAGSIYHSIDLISGNAVPILGANVGADTVSINRIVALQAKQDLATNPKALMYWGGGTGQLIAALAYTDIELEGYHFDAVVTFLPMGKDRDDKYYSYCVTVSVYDANSGQDKDGDGVVDRLQDEVLMNVMLGGMPK